MQFYLAHPVLSQEKIKKWQHSVELNTGVLFMNPFDQNDFEKKFINAFKKNKNDYNDIIRKLVEQDLELISKSDGVIAVIDGNLSYGTIQEMVYAKVFHKPLFLIITNGEEKHPWLMYHADKIFTSFRDLEEHLMKLHQSSKFEKFFESNKL